MDGASGAGAGVGASGFDLQEHEADALVADLARHLTDLTWAVQGVASASALAALIAPVCTLAPRIFIRFAPTINYP